MSNPAASSSPAPSELRWPSLDGLRAFEAAARLGSFERAAQELNVTASAISKRVGTLEQQLATPLLLRTSRELQPTAEGRDYLAQVRAVLATLAAIPLHRRPDCRPRRLRVMAPPTFARQILVPQLEAFTARHPDIALEVMLSIPALAPAGSDVDVEIRNGDPAALGGRQLMADIVVPVAAPSLLARLPSMQTPPDLRHAPLLGTPLERWTTWFAAAGLDWPEPTPALRLVDLGLLLEAAVSGQGVALARPSLARHWLASGALRRLFAIAAIPANQYCVTLRQDVEPARQFATWLGQVCAQAAQQGLEQLSRQH